GACGRAPVLGLSGRQRCCRFRWSRYQPSRSMRSVPRRYVQTPSSCNLPGMAGQAAKDLATLATGRHGVVEQAGEPLRDDFYAVSLLDMAPPRTAHLQQLVMRAAA